VALAKRYSLDPAQMALAFVTQQAFVTSNIIGARTMEQLARNIASSDMQLDQEVLEGIDKIHQRYPNPAP
jgi:aryl-alcohol dehydrogenase-like predicted oxidoreductase